MDKFEGFTDNMTGGQKCFLAVIGLLVVDTAVVNICKAVSYKHALKECKETKVVIKETSDDEKEKTED